jgi:hypothetical protein
MTKINRHNYEEFFLLYADGELSDQERTAVDFFTEQNTDLKSELKNLLQTRLNIHEEFIFEDKKFLFKTEATIHDGNYEELFLDYLDNELSDKNRNEVEQFLQTNNHHQPQFILLQSLKLEDKPIVFIEKHLLFRQDVKPVIWFLWKKMAIAAAFIGIIIILWSIYQTTDKHVFVTFKNKPSFINSKDQRPEKNTESALSKTEKNTIVSAQTIQLEKTANKRKTIQFQGSTSNLSVNKVIADQPEEQLSVQNTVVKNYTPELKPNNYKAEKLEYRTLAGTEDDQQAIITPTVYKELNTEEEPDKNNLYIGNIEVNKNKLRGFFKKAIDIFNTSKNEDSKVSIANFEITKSLK